MNHPLTLDASVLVSASNPGEKAFAQCRALLAAVRERELPLIEPTLMAVEIAGAIRRTQGNARLATAFVETFLRLPHLTLVPLDAGLMRRACASAIERSLRGADAVYVATALRYGAVLATLDLEQLARAPRAVRACTPADALRLVLE